MTDGRVRVEDLEAVVASARSRGAEPLARYVRRRLPDATEAEAADAAAVALEIIESVPVFLARAEQEADHRGLTVVIGPILGHAERYFLHPLDLMPEMTQGLPGLLDDAYLVLRVLQNLDRGPDRFLDWDLDAPLEFLRRLVGDDVARALDERSLDAMHEVATDVDRFRNAAVHDA